MRLHVCHVLLVEGQFGEAGPVFKRGRASDLENSVELIFLILSVEQWRAIDNLGEDAADGPNVHTRRVVFRSQ